MTVVTITYGDPDERTRNAIGMHAARHIRHLPNVTMYCNQFKGWGEWSPADGDAYPEFSGVIVADIPATVLHTVRAYLRDLAREHGQDAIGWFESDRAMPLGPSHAD